MNDDENIFDLLFSNYGQVGGEIEIRPDENLGGKRFACEIEENTEDFVSIHLLV